MTSTTTWEWSESALAALAGFLDTRGLTSGPLAAARIGDGHSNLTFRVTDGERSVIVRRPPPPPIPRGAHDMLREARFLTAVEGSGVPVPSVLATAQAGEVIDVPFYVMTLVEGPVVTTVTPAPLDSPESRRSVAESLIDTLAALHAVDWRGRGLGDAGRPEGFNERHLRRIGTLIADDEGHPPAAFEPIVSWLGSHVPSESGASIVHNDFRIGNVVLSPTSPGVVAAVLDWELATIGDPLFDLGYFLASVPVEGLPQTPTEELGTAMLEQGYPGRGALAERYAKRTGSDLRGLGWYSALAYWKLAVLYEYGRRRAERGDGDDYYSAAQVTSFLEAAERIAGAG